MHILCYQPSSSGGLNEATEVTTERFRLGMVGGSKDRTDWLVGKPLPLLIIRIIGAKLCGGCRLG